MRIVALTVYLILNKPSLVRMTGHLLKNAESLETLPLKHSGFNYFLPLETAECGTELNTVWSDEAERRIRVIEQGTVKPILGEQVMRELWARHYDNISRVLGDAFLDEVERTLERIVMFPEAWTPLSLRTRRCRISGFPYGMIY
jgi:hypothetical protein